MSTHLGFNGASSALVFFSALFIGSASYAMDESSNITREIGCRVLLVEETLTVTSSSENSSRYGDIRQSVERKIEERTALLKDERDGRPLLIRDVPDEQGNNQTDLKAGMARLFNHHILNSKYSAARDAITATAAEWVMFGRKLIEAEHEHLKEERKSQRPAQDEEGKSQQRPTQDTDGVFSTPFIEAHRAQLMERLNSKDLKFIFEKSIFKSMILSRQEAYLKTLLAENLRIAVLGLAEKYSRLVVEDGSALANEISDAYTKNKTVEPEFDKLDSRVSEVLVGFQTEFIGELRKMFPGLNSDVLNNLIDTMSQKKNAKKEHTPVPIPEERMAIISELSKVFPGLPPEVLNGVVAQQRKPKKQKKSDEGEQKTEQTPVPLYPQDYLNAAVKLTQLFPEMTAEQAVSLVARLKEREKAILAKGQEEAAPLVEQDLSAVTPELAKAFPDLNADALSLMQKTLAIKNSNGHEIVKNSDGHYSITLPQVQASATYVPEIATVALRLNPPRSDLERRLFNTMLGHGAGTANSNENSWAALLAMAGQAGSQAIAFGFPGSVGERGVGPNFLRKSLEVGVYMEKLAEYTRRTAFDPELPLIYIGRSMGSTDGVAYVTAASRLGFTPSIDALILWSFSDPTTLEEQTQNVYAQLARGDIPAVVPESLDHSTARAEDLQAHLSAVRSDELTEREKQIQNRTWLLQGEADEDGNVPSKPFGSVIPGLFHYRNKYLPFAHVYPIYDPLKKYRLKGIIPLTGSQGQEATHFLDSARDNLSEAHRGSYPPEIPEKDLPQLRNQHYETHALNAAALDYEIDLSSVTSGEHREALRQKRLKATGSDKPFAYLAYYVENTVNPRVPEAERMTLEQIVADRRILPHRDSGLYGRMKRVYQFMLDEELREKRLLGLAPPESSIERWTNNVKRYFKRAL